MGDLSDEPGGDLAIIEAMERDMPLPLDPVTDDEMRRRLFRDAGPHSKEAGIGDRVLAVTASDAVSRGIAGTGLRG